MTIKKTQFLTKAAINGSMPLWAKLTFDISLLLSTVITFVVASDPTISDPLKIKIGVYNAAAVLFIRGLAKCFGVTLHEKET